MNIAFINGSPRVKDSASGYILQELQNLLEEKETTISYYNVRKPGLKPEEIDNLKEIDVLVFAFPLYVDGIPSHLLNCLVQLEPIFRTVKGKKITVYTLVNCGFYEGKQNQLAIEIMENWCYKAGLKWGQGIGIGAGGMLLSIKNVPMGHGPKKNFGVALTQFASNIQNCSSEKTVFINANFPRFLYKMGAEMGWRQAVKENGLKRKDLFLRK